MIEFADLILASGRAAIELALYILMPVMVLMLIFMRLLDSWGVLQRIAALAAPLLRPVGVPGLGVFAMLQVVFVGFAAPVATLALMDRQGTSERHIAATLAMVLTLPQANVIFPMAAVGLEAGWVLLLSLPGGFAAAAATYYVFGRRLAGIERSGAAALESAPAPARRGTFATIQGAGREGMEIALGAIPMLMLALFAVYLLRHLGAIDVLERALAPLFALLQLPAATVLALVTKYIAGGTAVMAVLFEMLKEGAATAGELNRLAGVLIHPLDVAGVAVLVAAGPRVAAVTVPALAGAAVGVLVRTLLHFAVY